jgi:two-component system sensor histidine kinase KdpD
VLAVVAPVAVTVGLSPLRGSLGLAGALFAALVVVAGVAALGGVGPAAAATVVSFLGADYRFTEPLHSLAVSSGLDVAALVAFAVVGGSIGTLITVLAGRGMAESQRAAGAANLARALADIVVETGPTAELPALLRRTLGLAAVAVLVPDGPEWRTVASAGGPVPDRPSAAAYAVELPDRSILALCVDGPSAVSPGALEAFVSELRIATERVQLDALGVPAARRP